MLIPGPAGARDDADTFLTIVNTADFENAMFVYGFLESDKNKCLENRKVQFLTSQPGKRGSFFVVDVDRTSRNGTWAVSANDTELGVTLRVKALKRRVGNTSCRADTEGVPD